MPADASSNIRVFVRWTDQTVFAGEEIKCRITFKNAAHDPSQPKRSPSNAPTSTGDRPRLLSPLHSQSSSVKTTAGLTPPASAATVRGHRSTLSLNVPSAASPLRNGSVPWSPQSNASDRSSRRGSHKRSISIVSINSTSTVDDRSRTNGSPVRSGRQNRGHGRSSSLQITPRGGHLNGPHTATLPLRQSVPLSSPQFNASYPPDKSYSKRQSLPSTVPNTPARTSQPSPRTGRSTIPEFRFPIKSPSSDTGANGSNNIDERISPMTGPGSPPSGSGARDTIPTITEHMAPVTRVLAATSIGGGTPRSSGEFYALSNNSTETLASEYPPQHQPVRTAHNQPPHIRKPSNLSPLSQSRGPEALMMGYAQVQGSFTLDGSLIDLAPFDQVKRKAIVGGQGGGVVGVETSKQNGGLLKGFGWGSLLGDLVGGNELSSIKEMRGMASSRSIPLLSTPQSILFVDIKLRPGESKSYDYTFRLPKGLPPTHRGKAMKITYTLVIGIQRARGSREQQVRSIEVPFRVLGSVNSHGEILGHDLMAPYIILRDQADVKAVEKHAFEKSHRKTKSTSPPCTYDGFLSYVDELLNQSRDAPGLGLLSPTEIPNSRRPSTYSEPVNTAKEAIELAILRSNQTGGQHSANRFEIARNGLRVGVVMLTRPSYRLGEVITLVVDFADAEIPCYAVHAALETTEKIENSLALRSESSIHRVTRKVYVSSSETTLYSRRIVFTPTIPVNATPEFVTSGVSLEWKIRLEFVVPSSESEIGQLSHASGTQTPAATAPHHLLEEISKDDRGGLVLVAAENLICESFEVGVPLRVYGVVCSGLEKLERDEALEEGLVI